MESARYHQHPSCACARRGCRLSVLCYTGPALPFMATQPLRKVFPSVSVLFAHALQATSHLLLFPCCSSPPSSSTICRSNNWTNSTEPAKINWYVGAKRHQRSFSLVVLRDNLVLLFTGSWSSASTDWSLCGWYRWAVITAQWEWPWITLLRLNGVSTQYSNRSTWAAICLMKELRSAAGRAAAGQEIAVMALVYLLLFLRWQWP